MAARRADQRDSNGLGWALVTPAVGVLLLLTIFPALYLLWASFRRFNLMMPDNAAFIGLATTGTSSRMPTSGTACWSRSCSSSPRSGSSWCSVCCWPYARAEKPLERRRRNAPDPADGGDAGGFGARLARAVQPNYGWVNYYLRKIGIMQEPIAWTILRHPGSPSSASMSGNGRRSLPHPDGGAAGHPAGAA